MEVGVDAALFSSPWFMALFVVAAVTVISSVIGSLTMRAVDRRMQGEQKQNERLEEQEAALNELKLQILEGEKCHQQSVHALEMELLRCQRNVCGQRSEYVTQQEHKGDLLRLQRDQEKRHTEMMDALRAVHGRFDDFLHSFNTGVRMEG